MARRTREEMVKYWEERIKKTEAILCEVHNRLRKYKEKMKEEKFALLKKEILRKFEEEFDMYNPIYDDGIKIPVWNKADFENFKSFLSYSLDRIYQVIEEEKRRSN